MAERRISRRNFVAAASVAGLFGGGSGTLWSDLAKPLAVGDADDESLPKLGVASYSLRNFTRQQALEMTRSLGVKYINLKSVHLPYDASPAEFATARAELAAAGLRLVGGGTITFETDTDDGVRKYFEYARAAGMPTIVCTCKPAVLPRIEKFARQYDIKVAIHNHGPSDKHFPTPDSALKLIQKMDPRVGVCMDIGHTMRAGVDPAVAAKDAGPRLLDMHFKDVRKESNGSYAAVDVGDGEIAIPALFRQLEKMNYAGYCNLEHEVRGDDRLPGMQKSFAYARGVLAALA